MNQQEKYQKAKMRVAALKKFYVHLGVYVLVNLSLFLRNIIISPDRLWFFWPLLGWSIAIALHALSVFSLSRPFGADWEERKIAQFMEE
ncbi:MAG: 2TM domain-containing protein [Chloroflexi bacterium]|nr:2TM domain-containing protein [Chloroflexota bacterium]